MFDPETIIKGLVIFWVVSVIGYAGCRILWWACTTGRIKVKATFDEDQVSDTDADKRSKGDD